MTVNNVLHAVQPVRLTVFLAHEQAICVCNTLRAHKWGIILYGYSLLVCLLLNYNYAACLAQSILLLIHMGSVGSRLSCKVQFCEML